MASTSASPADATSSSSALLPNEHSAPPPLPNEPVPSASTSGVVDLPIDSLGDDDDDDDDDDDGDDDDDEDDEDGDGDAGDGVADGGEADSVALDGAAGKSGSPPPEKGKGKAGPATSGADGAGDADADAAQPWQAVWAPEQNAWYFWNSTTGEVTWTNPLAPPPLPSTSTSAHPSANAASSAPTATATANASTSALSSASAATPRAAVPFQPPLPAGPPPKSAPVSDPRFGLPPSIDPELAYLLPSEQRGSAAAGAEGQIGLFNARTGRFTQASNAYSIDHLDEYNRAKRMNSHYFDQDAWERQMAADHAKRKREEAEGIAPKKITRKDMERFKKKKQEQKMRSQAWLRD